MRATWSAAAVVAAAVLAPIALDLRPSGTFALFRMVMLLPIVVITHELGHAVASWILGHRVLEIRIGSGPSIRTWIGRTRVSIGILPIDGAVASGSPDAAGFRWKRAAIIVAGPAVNAATVVAALSIGARSDLLRDLAIVNVWVLVTNLLPFSQRTSLGPQPNDGLAFVRTLADPQNELDEQRAAIRVMEAQHLREQGRIEEARALGDETFERFPGSRIARTWRGYELVLDGRYAEARTVFAQLVEDDRRSGSDGRGRRVTSTAIHLNNLAWADLMLEDPGLLAEADGASGTAIELLPDSGPIMGTRAFALIATKRFTEGIALGERAFRKERDRRNRALQACVVAIGHARGWTFDEAARWRAVAWGLDPECQLLPRVDRDLALGPSARTRADAGVIPRPDDPSR